METTATASSGSPRRRGTFAPAQRKVGDVDAVLPQHRSHVADHARHVAVLHEDQEAGKRHFAVDAVHLRQPRLVQQDRAFHRGQPALGFQVEADRIGRARTGFRAPPPPAIRAVRRSAWRSPGWPFRRWTGSARRPAPALRSRLVLPSAMLAEIGQPHARADSPTAMCAAKFPSRSASVR